MTWFRNLIINYYKCLDWIKNHKLDLSYNGIIYHLKEVFKRPEMPEYENNKPIILKIENDDGVILDTDLSRNSLIKVFDYDIFPEPVISGKDKLPGILIVDDASMTKYLYDSDFRKIKREMNRDILNEFTIYSAYGEKSGYIGYKALLNNDYNIQYAILDITLGYTIKHNSGLYLELDGVDLAIKLLTLNPKSKFIFISAHTLNLRNPVMKKYIDKFNNITGLDIMDYYVNKSGISEYERYIAIYNLLYGDLYGKQ